MNRCFEVVSDKFRKFPEEEIKLPKRADSQACGYDFYSLENVTINPGESYLFFTDVKAKMYFDNRLEINTRSGNGTKFKVILANTIGYIDASYYNNPTNDGNIGICLLNNGDKPFIVKKGDRIAQGCFSRYLITDDDEYRNSKNKNTRLGGFGSTGN